MADRQVFVDVIESQANDDRTAAALQTAVRARASLRRVLGVQVLQGRDGFIIMTVLEATEEEAC